MNGASPPSAVAGPSGGPPSYTFSRGDEAEIADALLSVLGPDPLVYSDGVISRYVPSSGIWVSLSREEVEATVVAFAGMPVVSRGNSIRPLTLAHRTIVGATKIACSKLAALGTADVFSRPRTGVAFANGFVTVTNGSIQLHAHDPLDYARHAHPFDFAQGTPHPKLDTFLDDLFADAAAAERVGRIELLQDFIGTCLVGGATRYQKCLVLHGPGANGKSSFLDIARAAFPPNAVVSVPPQLWAERFQVVRLVGAMANLVDEVPDRDITGGALFKSVISGEPVHAERKHRDAFEFRPIAGHIFSANVLPGTVDQSDGFWRRFIVCPFTRNMTQAATCRPDAARDVVANELPATVAWALEGAARVQAQGGYTVSASAVTLLDEWRRDADPVRRFIEEHCVVDAAASATPDEVYRTYKHWAFTNGFAEMSSTKFFRRLGAASVPKTHVRTGNTYALRCRQGDSRFGS